MNEVGANKKREVVGWILGIPKAIEKRQLQWHLRELWRIAKWKEPPNVEQ